MHIRSVLLNLSTLLGSSGLLQLLDSPLVNALYALLDRVFSLDVHLPSALVEVAQLCAVVLGCHATIAHSLNAAILHLFPRLEAVLVHLHPLPHRSIQDRSVASSHEDGGLEDHNFDKGSIYLECELLAVGDRYVW